MLLSEMMSHLRARAMSDVGRMSTTRVVSAVHRREHDALRERVVLLDHARGAALESARTRSSMLVLAAQVPQPEQDQRAEHDASTCKHGIIA